jgi:hypothetical protein
VREKLLQQISETESTYCYGSKPNLASNFHALNKKKRISIIAYFLYPTMRRKLKRVSQFARWFDTFQGYI